MHSQRSLNEEQSDEILNYLRTSNTDLFRCALTVPAFNVLLEPSKAAWLFEKVFPFIHRRLDEDDIWNCRLTCWSWCHAVDSFLEDHSFYRPYSKPNKEDQLLPLLRPMEFFKSQFLKPYIFSDDSTQKGLYFGSESPVRGEQLFEFAIFDPDHPRNPFIGRSVGISTTLSGYGPFREFLPDVADFLREFGQHVWHFTYEYPHGSSYSDPNNILDSVIGSCSLLPELKSLHLKGTCEMTEWWKMEDWMNHLQWYMKFDRPIFPPTPHLDTLKINVKGLPLVCQDFFIAQVHAQLRRLEVPTWNPDCAFAQRLTNLVDLHFTRIQSSDELQTLLLLECPLLQRLHLTLNYTSEDPSLCLERLLKITNHFVKLHLLSLTCSRNNWNPSLEQVSKLPHNLFAPSNLEILELLRNDPPPALNFLLRFPYLKVLHLDNIIIHSWNHNKDSPSPITPNPGTEELIDLVSCLTPRRIYQSTIWKILPSLETITCQNMELDTTGEPEEFEEVCNDVTSIYSRDLYQTYMGITKA